MWSNYFGPQAKITGIDIDVSCKFLKYEEKNIEVRIGDQGSSEFWDMFLAENPHIDVLIDDGGHYMDQQILTFEKVFPRMPVGSIYICEDVHTSYMAHNGGGYGVKSSFINYAKGYVDVVHSCSPLAHPVQTTVTSFFMISAARAELPAAEWIAARIR